VRIVAALGGNALLRRGESADVAVQLRHLGEVVPGLAEMAVAHEVVLTHGNGPQVGQLALESAADPALQRPYPLDTLVAETEGMIGYWLVRELGGAMPGREVVALVTQVVVAANDPAFAAPTKFIGPGYERGRADELAAAFGWTVRQYGAGWWRRVVASPDPLGIVELAVIRRLVDQGVLVIAAGGGGVPVIRTAAGALRGVEAVVDKDLAAARLAAGLDADVLLLLTDVPAVYAEFGTPRARPIRKATPESLRGYAFPAGSMGPKVAAACRFVAAGHGRRAVIGALEEVLALADGTAGTLVLPDPPA
jgi:carbamate kinase